MTTKFFALILVLRAATAAAQSSSKPRTILDGVYTEVQARRGLEAYDAKCGSCHKPSLDGGAEAMPLRGDHFLQTWREDTLSALFNHMQTRMPRRPVGEPGTLASGTYIDIIAYILKVNEYPVGANELTQGALAETIFVGPEGPKPLTTNSVVQVAGCFTPGPRDTWLLSRAGDLARTRSTEPSSAEELNTAAQKPLGNQQFRLTNLDDLKADTRPETLKGQKVFVKGPLTRSTTGDRIFVLSLEAVPASAASVGCGG